ncbi:Dehydrogenases with different specificities (related to short-chain alcohol dehydrogenases) [Rhodococcus wratislaviensis]|uniref:Dehydrogenases with different specificities (Related to short-chain alcohol dehydrogenases) n=1 Tax=Rhodococcus wratislaviensis TaxID=44752 RepID=A0A402C5F7_RHOWR|nr:oxidoreductase [Rhodococcus wratislaviensis]GCE38798.1 Dehydrogenases with different specificities (related to short-chain alcohol dehydrogenases) [Rhodococcus wratislaviensis]
MSVWFITGSSRGFGLEITRAALAAGHQVVATARTADTVRKQLPDAGDTLLTVPLDVTDPQSIQTAVDTAVERFGRIDVLVNNAGTGLLAAVEESDDAAVRAVYETNVFGPLAVQRAVLPLLRHQRCGHVINISSIVGFATAPGWGIYASTKFAVEGFTETLRTELAPLGVHVTLVEPGFFRTDFLDPASLQSGNDVIDDYAPTAGAMRHAAAGLNHAQPGDPAKAARAIVDIAATPEPPLRLPLGADTLAAFDAKLDSFRKELDDWRHIALSTDHD